MNRRYYKNTRRSKVKKYIISKIEKNIKEYTIITIIFFIGILIGVIFINNISETQSSEISNYINSSITMIKENNNIDEIALLKDSIGKNFVLALILWFMGSTFIGISIVYLIICFRGFCLGYTISSIIITCGIGKGMLFLLSTIFLQNIIFIPCIIALAVSGMKLHNSIIKDRRAQNIKIEVLRHTIFSMLITALLILCSMIEVYVSKNLLLLFMKYI